MPETKSKIQTPNMNEYDVINVRQEQADSSLVVSGEDTNTRKYLQETEASMVLSRRSQPQPLLSTRTRSGDGDGDGDSSFQSALFDMIIIGPEDEDDNYDDDEDVDDDDDGEYQESFDPPLLSIEVPLVPPPIEALEIGPEFEPDYLITRTRCSIVSLSSSTEPSPSLPATATAPAAVGALRQGVAAAVLPKSKKRKANIASKVQQPPRLISNENDNNEIDSLVLLHKASKRRAVKRDVRMR